eukprot:COSAG01_NODE_4111_length_5339_cov_13.132443_2_plen_47_part_00
MSSASTIRFGLACTQHAYSNGNVWYHGHQKQRSGGVSGCEDLFESE